MKITYSIQKVDFYDDQAEEKGEVGLHGAIEAFQNFPFEEQLKEIPLIEYNSCLLGLVFKNDNNTILTVWAEDTRGFFIRYFSGEEQSVLYIFNSFDKNAGEECVEDYIESFFNGNIENDMVLRLVEIETEDEEMDDDGHPIVKKKISDKGIVSFSYKESNKWSLYQATFVGLAATSFVSLLMAKQDLHSAGIMFLILSPLWLPGTILHLSYWLKNDGAEVVIDTHAKTLIYTKGETVVKFHRSDIYNC